MQVGNFISYGVCKFAFLGSPLGHPKGVPCAELSPQVTEGLPTTSANRFHKELRFFFSLLKRKKEAKKEKSSRFTCTTRSSITRRLHINKNPPAGHTGGLSAVTLPFSHLKLGRKVSGDSPPAVTLPFLQLKLGRKESPAQEICSPVQGFRVFCRLYASEFFCEGTAYKLVSHAGIYSWCRIYKS